MNNPVPGNTGKGLDYFHTLVCKTIISQQDSITGLLRTGNFEQPTQHDGDSEENDHAWIRDNVYSITCVWALSMAYRSEEDELNARSYQLEKSVVRCMRGLLRAMMSQREKVEKFKGSLSSKDSLHAKFSAKTGKTVVEDEEWGHLQIDAISLYLLSLAQMTAGGLQIIFTLDEVAFVQNLVFYIECAYITPDYGVWERGAKSNTGITELNSSSIGMAKAALEAMNELDLFGGKGSPASVIHVLPDEAVKCAAVLQSMLPRESNSKETDAAILSVIGYPAFSVSDEKLIEMTLATIQSKLGGRYGMKRFLRDGYKTLREDTSRLHYEPWELRLFDNIECEWPLFFCYMAINFLFEDNLSSADEYIDMLDGLCVPKNGMKLLPELYRVPVENMKGAEDTLGTVDRVPEGRCPLMSAESLFIVVQLLRDGYLSPAELDPLNRRLSSVRKPDVVVQVVVLAENQYMQQLLCDEGIHVPTCEEINPIEVRPAKVLSHLFTFLGRSKKLELTGRKSLDVGILSTSHVYEIQDKLFVFTPQSFDRSSNYIDTDNSLAMSTLAYGLDYLGKFWSSPGRPTVTLILTKNMLEEKRKVSTPIVNTLHKLANGYINGTRVCLGTYEEFRPTSCFTKLAFLGNIEGGEPENLDPAVEEYLSEQLFNFKIEEPVRKLGATEPRRLSEGITELDTNQVLDNPMMGSMKRSRSICPDAESWKETVRHLEEIREMDSEDDSDTAEYFMGTSTCDSSESLSIRTDVVINPRRQRLESNILDMVDYSEQEIEDLVDMLQDSDDIEVQGDILHFMVITYGMNYDVGQGTTVKDLLLELYESACSSQEWSIVRHTSGLLERIIPDIGLCLTDLIVRQKQVTVGLPPDNEVIISQPLGSTELCGIINKASNGDMSASALTQEVLVYLAMFIRTEPSLFHGMLRLRVGLILQVMASEFARSLGISGEEATDQLLNLSPFETNNLLHHIMSGQEYSIQVHGSRTIIVNHSNKITKLSSSKPDSHVAMQTSQRRMSCFPPQFQSIRLRHLSFQKSFESGVSLTSIGEEDDLLSSHGFEDEDIGDREGMWVRRRLLDGSLNRVPPDFYTQIWSLLLKCQGISVHGNILPQTVTQEMTSGEMAFHLHCEALLNTISEPDFRQLVVETILMLILAAENGVLSCPGTVIPVEDIVKVANGLFLEDQRQCDGDATLCCTENVGACGGACGICVHFYDSAPSGPHGTMSYIVRATCCQLGKVPEEGDISCFVM